MSGFQMYIIGIFSPYKGLDSGIYDKEWELTETRKLALK